MLCALPAAARKPVYRAHREYGETTDALDAAWRDNGAPNFRCDPDDYTNALVDATRADVRRAVAELLEKDAS